MVFYFLLVLEHVAQGLNRSLYAQKKGRAIVASQLAALIVFLLLLIFLEGGFGVVAVPMAQCVAVLPCYSGSLFL